MWFWLALAALICWSGSDLLSKLGCQDADDRYSHLKMVMAVGLVMGFHACWEIFAVGTEINGDILLAYLPVSAFYILSMAVGYLGMRYIELSISSPICNSSGAVVVLLIFATRGFGELPTAAIAAAVLVCIGFVLLGVTESTEDPELRRARQDKANRHYVKSWIALALPVIYCVLDALGTFADSIILETLDENSANVAYELTFLAAGLVCAVYVLVIKRQRLVFSRELPKYAAAVLETGGQFAYIFALGDTQHAALTVPIVSSYCVGSVILSRVILRERLSKKHYLSVFIVVLGIVILGILDI